MIYSLNLLIVDKLSSLSTDAGIFRQHTEFTSYHKFVFRVLSIYMHLNILLMPLLGYSEDSGLTIIKKLVTWSPVKRDFIFGQNCRLGW